MYTITMYIPSKGVHKTVTDRRIITNTEWAAFLNLSRPTVIKYIKNYPGEYNPKDIYSVLRFYKHLLTICG